MRASIRAIITTYRKLGNVLDTASELHISRMTVYRWLRRARGLTGNLKWKGVHRYSTRPKKIHQKLTPTLETEILQILDIGHVGARKLQWLSQAPISSRTIHRLLKKKNLVVDHPAYRRPLYQNGACMRPANTKDLGYLQMDTKHVTPELSGLLTTVYEYAAIDILSRYKVAVLLPDISSDSASLSLELFLKWFPFPVKYIQTDNGLEFQKNFQLSCDKHQIEHYFIHKNSPNENAVIERSFKTDQEEFYFWLKNQPEHIGQLNEWLQIFINKYNTWRPHQALNYQTPMDIVRLHQL